MNKANDDNNYSDDDNDNYDNNDSGNSDDDNDKDDNNDIIGFLRSSTTGCGHCYSSVRV